MKVFTKTFVLLAFLFTNQLASQDLTTMVKEVEPTVKINGPISEISFESTVFNWGEIKPGEKIQNVFKFQNTGEEPIVITNAKGSCGCTVPKWPTEPIMPGETAEILVQFNSKNKKGLQSKRVTITANTEPAHTYLTIKGRILETETDVDEVAEVKPMKNTKDFDVASADVLVYPNPSQNEIELQLSAYKGESALFEIYNMQGEKMLQKNVDKLIKAPVKFDISSFINGTYVVVAKVGELNRIAKQFTVLK